MAHDRRGPGLEWKKPLVLALGGGAAVAHYKARGCGPGASFFPVGGTFLQS